MKLTDTHAHLYWESFKEDFDEMIQRALDAEVSTIINVGVDIEKSQVALDQAKSTNWPNGLSVYSTMGIHPHEAIKYDSVNFLQKAIQELEEIYNSDPKKVVGIGECGLDYFRVFEESRSLSEAKGSYFFESNPGFIPPNISNERIKELQQQLFQAQIDLAKKLNLPLVVHCRDDRSKDPQNSKAWDEVLEMVGNHPTILHCYSGLSHTTNYILQTTNLLVSFAANITYPKNEYLRKAAKTLPLEKILLETDSPFLAPQSKRGQQNEPSAIKEIAKLIADLKGTTYEEVASQTTKNAQKIFNI